METGLHVLVQLIDKKHSFSPGKPAEPAVELISHEQRKDLGPFWKRVAELERKLTQE